MNAATACRPASAEDNILMLQTLIESGVQLAHAAAAKAMKQMAAADPDPAAETPGKSRARTPDPTLLFLRLWGAVRQTLALQSRLAAKPQTQPAPANRTTPAPQPAAAPVMEAIERLARELAQSGKTAARYASSLSPPTKTPPFQPAMAGKR